MTKFNTRYEWRKSSPMVFSGESKTKSEFKKDCDINTILKNYKKTGILPRNEIAPQFADVSQIGDYRECVEKVRLANEAFLSLDSKIRKEFENDPAKLLDFMQNPANAEKAREIGLLPQIDTPVVPQADLPDPTGTPE